jgi:hypothetical protein
MESFVQPVLLRCVVAAQRPCLAASAPTLLNALTMMHFSGVLVTLNAVAVPENKRARLLQHMVSPAATRPMQRCRPREATTFGSGAHGPAPRPAELPNDCLAIGRAARHRTTESRSLGRSAPGSATTGPVHATIATSAEASSAHGAARRTNKVFGCSRANAHVQLQRIL